MEQQGRLATDHSQRLDSLVHSAWEQVLDSDPLKYSDVGPQGAPQPDAWLLENSEGWLYPTRRPTTEISAARVVLVVGEAGCGKSTSMRLVAQDLRRANRIPVFIDFGHVPTTQGRDFSAQELTKALALHISNQIRTRMNRTGQQTALEAQLIRAILGEFHTAGIGALIREHPDIATWPDDRLVACDEAIEISRAIESSEFEHFLALTAVQMISPQSPPVLILDNLEGLPPAARRILIGKLTAVLRPRTLLFMAIRAENRLEADILLQDRNDEIFELEKVDQSLLEIAKIRNNGARDFISSMLQDESSDFAALQTSPDEVHDKIADQHARFERAVENLMGDEFSFAMASNWLNANVRNFLGLMAALSRNLPSGGDFAEMRAWLSSTLFKTRTHSSLASIFDQAHYASTKFDLPFVFLPLRILFYVHTRGGNVSIADVRDHFALHFGIMPDDIKDALVAFTRREPGYAQPVRMYTDSEGASHVMLLKCGKVFVEQALYQFDFLAHLFDRVERGQLHGNYRDLINGGGRMPESRLKLLKAAAVIDELVLPALCLEHPYMDAPRPLTDDEFRRLDSYNVMFRFGRGQWFIGALRTSMEVFAKKRGYVDDINPTLTRLDLYERRLNEIVASRRQLDGEAS